MRFNSDFPSVNLLSPEATSKLLEVSVGTLSVWRCTGRYNLPYVKIGRKVRYRASDVVAFIESRLQTGGSSHHE